MTTERWLDEWRTAGIISADRHATLSALVRKDRFSVFLELNALLYLGVVAFGAGLAWTVRDHFARFGDAAILAALVALVAAPLFYCFTRAEPYSPDRVESSDFAFDYVLYLGCLAFAVLLGYVEYRFQLLKARWDDDLLVSALVYFGLAYRFDNRFVLSLALSTLAGFFGVRLVSWDVLPSTMRAAAVAYGVVVAAVGVGMQRLAVKPHFLEAYLHVAGNAVLLAVTSGAMGRDSAWWWLALLLGAAAAAVVLGIRFRRFAFVVYGVVYGYVGVSAQVLRGFYGDTETLAYFVVSGLAVVGGLALLSRRFGRDG